MTFAYDRLGRQQIISDAVGTRTFAYSDALQLESETITGLYDQVITRTYEAGEVKGRPVGFNIGADYSVTYGYDETGRFNSLDWNAAGSFNTATYSFVENSNLLQQLTTGNGLRTTYSYESNRNLRTQIKNEYGTNLISQYDYGYDDLGRRTTVANSGQAFTVSAFNRYGYDDRNQLTESSRYQGSDINDLGNPVQPEYRSYGYDPIGNSINATGWDEGAASPEDAAYTVNSLNQYSQITKDNGSASGEAAANLTYDFDGNLTEISRANSSVQYRYNAENRLIAVEPQIPVDGNVKVEYTYDYIGRRVKKTVYTNESDLWSLTSDILFLYDGWNVVKEITAENGQPAGRKYYVWGLDLSQSQQGAGGIGGLLASVEGSLTHYFYYDGNGNVGQLVNTSDGSISAHYEYDPFGNSTFSIGPKAEANPYRFSTKYFDSEIELYYYGYRYYSSEVGRWLTRDPLGEKGGINLYNMVANNPIDKWDFLGQFTPVFNPTIPARSVKSIQNIIGRNPDGMYGHATASAVKGFQSHLQRLGHYSGAIDGKWGSATEQAYQKFLASRKDDPQGPSYTDGLMFLESGLKDFKTTCEINSNNKANVKCCKTEARKIINALKQSWTLNYGFGPDLYGSDPVAGHFCWDWANIFNSIASNLSLTYWSNEQGYARSPGSYAVHWFVKFYAYKKKGLRYRVNVDDGFMIANKMVFPGAFPDSYTTSYKEKPLPVAPMTGRNQPLNPFTLNQW